jgi:beta-lactamase superfamily II metal-dependent hydrolase
MSVFRLVMHPASEGDALTLSWGEEGKLFHALIDLGRPGDYRALRPLLQQTGRFEFFTISHIDADHIGGAMPLVREKSAPFKPADVWFNAWHHLKNAAARCEHAQGLETLSAKQGEKVSNAILEFGWPWNRAFGPSGIVSVDTPEAQPHIELAGNLKVSLLSPGDEELAALEPVWMDELARANLRPLDPDEVPEGAVDDLEALGSLNVEALARRPFVEDDAKPNGSSIAFVAEFDGRRALLGADAHPGVIERALRKLGYSEANKLKLDLFKLCHHGSKANTSPSLLGILDCLDFAISTDGTRHDHPDPETVARILVNDPLRQKTIHFNVNQPHATIWDRKDLKDRYKFACEIPPGDSPGQAIEIRSRAQRDRESETRHAL